MSEAELAQAVAWVNDHFAFIRADDEARTIDLILASARRRWRGMGSGV